MKRRRCIFHDDIFITSWAVQRGGTKQEAVDWYCKLVKAEQFKVEDKDSYACFYQAPFRKNGLLWFDKNQGAGGICHEVMHAVIHFMDNLDIKISQDTEELAAYYAEWLTKTIVKRLWTR